MRDFGEVERQTDKVAALELDSNPNPNPSFEDLINECERFVRNRMKDIFDTYVANAFGDGGQDSGKLRQFEMNYRRILPSDFDADLLDIGIGRGEMLTCMRNWGYTRFRGIDISPSTIAFCSSIGLPCEQVADTTSWLQEHVESFDCITLLDVLEHIPKEQTIPLLRALKDSLRGNGVAIVQVPNMQAPDSQLHRYNCFTHEVGYIEHSLRQVLQVAGFSTIAFGGFEDSVSHSVRGRARLVLRRLLWSLVRFLRRVNGNLNPAILHPVFYALAVKQ